MSEISTRKLSLWKLLRIWFMLGIQSFGGGTATLYLIRRAAVEQHAWLTPEEFTRDWALCLAAPGINLLCLTILIGRRVAGFAGSLVALIGLLLPSATLTIIMTAYYADLRNLPIMQSALRGVVPATVGLGLLVTVSMAQPALKSSRQESIFSLLVSVAILLGSGLVMLFWQMPVIFVLIAAGVIGALAMWQHVRHKKAGVRD